MLVIVTVLLPIITDGPQVFEELGKSIKIDWRIAYFTALYCHYLLAQV